MQVEIEKFKRMEFLLEKAVEFDGGPVVGVNGILLPDDYSGAISHYKISKKKNYKTGKITWAVTNGDSCLSMKEMDFVYDLIPSEKNEDFLNNTRFETIEEAFVALKRWKESFKKELRNQGWRDLEK